MASLEGGLIRGGPLYMHFVHVYLNERHLMKGHFNRHKFALLFMQSTVGRCVHACADHHFAVAQSLHQVNLGHQRPFLADHA